MCKFRNHPSIVKIKERCKVKGNFSIRLANTEEIKAIIRDLPTNKAVGGEIPVNISKKLKFAFNELTICVSYALISGKFRITLKMLMLHPYIRKTIQQIKQISDQLVFCPCSQKCLNGLFITN